MPSRLIMQLVALFATDGLCRLYPDSGISGTYKYIYVLGTLGTLRSAPFVRLSVRFELSMLRSFELEKRPIGTRTRSEVVSAVGCSISIRSNWCRPSS